MYLSRYKCNLHKKRVNMHERLKFFRTTLKLTQKDFAEKIEIDQRNYTNYENGKAELKEYLERWYCPFTGETLLSKSYGANVNPKRYFAEVNNRVVGHQRYCQDLFLAPVFMTITLPSEYHPFKTENGLRVANPLYNGKTVREAMFDLSNDWRGFLDLQLLKRIKKAGGRVYMKTVEPHESGVPHLHIMMWIPKNYIIALKGLFKKYFKGRTTYKYKFDGDEGGAVAYIMKYLNKTFKHSQTEVMTDEAYWCALHKIRRFTTSRTLIPLKYFRKCNYDERYQDYYEFSKAVFGNYVAICFQGNYIFRRCVIDDDWWDDVIFLKDDSSQKNLPAQMPPVFSKEQIESMRSKKTYRNSDIYIDEDSVYVPLKKSFARMSDMELFDYYHNEKTEYNPFSLVEFERFKRCEAEYFERFSLFCIR